jgi:hypothetical protein
VECSRTPLLQKRNGRCSVEVAATHRARDVAIENTVQLRARNVWPICAVFEPRFFGDGCQATSVTVVVKVRECRLGLRPPLERGGEWRGGGHPTYCRLHRRKRQMVTCFIPARVDHSSLVDTPSATTTLPLQQEAPPDTHTTTPHILRANSFLLPPSCVDEPQSHRASRDPTAPTHTLVSMSGRACRLMVRR